MSANIIDLAEERGRRRQAPEPAPPPLPNNLEWKISKKVNPYVVVNGAYHVVLFRHRGSAWAFRIEELETERAWFSERRYETEDAARAEALLAVSELRGTEPERLA
jgi:hypothetical protein